VDIECSLMASNVVLNFSDVNSHAHSIFFVELSFKNLIFFFSSRYRNVAEDAATPNTEMLIKKSERPVISGDNPHQQCQHSKPELQQMLKELRIEQCKPEDLLIQT